MNYESSTGKPGGTISNQPITLFLAGDVMTGRGIDQILPDSVHPVLFEPYVKNAKKYVQMAEHCSGPLPRKISYDYIWGDALKVLNQIKPDGSIINLETSITTHAEPWPNKSIHYRMHPRNTKIFTEAGINICLLGNNHTMDWCETGLRETLQVLKDHGLITAGAGTDSKHAETPAVLQTDHGRVLVFSYATPGAGTPKAWQAKRNKPGVNLLESLGIRGFWEVLHKVKTHRIKNDRVVISLHWGNNWGYNIPDRFQSFAHRLIDQKLADVIYGHSSHHPRGIEVYKNRLIMYGCGDLINDYEGIKGQDEFRGDLSLMYFPTLDPSGSLISLRMAPMKIHQFRLTKASRNDTDWLSERLDRVCEKFGTAIEQTGEGDLILRSKL